MCDGRQKLKVEERQEGRGLRRKPRPNDRRQGHSGLLRACQPVDPWRSTSTEGASGNARTIRIHSIHSIQRPDPLHGFFFFSTDFQHGPSSPQYFWISQLLACPQALKLHIQATILLIGNGPVERRVAEYL